MPTLLDVEVVRQRFAALPGRLKSSNAALIEVKKQLESGRPRSAIRRMLDRIIEGYGVPGDPRYAYAMVPWM